MIVEKNNIPTVANGVLQIPKRTVSESILEYAARVAGAYAKAVDSETRKKKGQFFSPRQISVFMAGLFDIRQADIHLLDPGGGTGILTAAFCERILRENVVKNLSIDMYENDPAILPFLEATLEACQTALKRRGCKVQIRILNRDFILSNQGFFSETDMFLNHGQADIFYDFIISNPPYYKLNKNSLHSRTMQQLISGQPNIYMFFIALAARLLKPGGEMVFITPRSFCSGSYYKRFREWFLNTVNLTHIHLFESRKAVFHNDDILQENIIFKALKTARKDHTGTITVTTSANGDFENLSRLKVAHEKIVRRDCESYIRIPATPGDIEVFDIVDQWPKTFQELGFQISTGPVVTFRATDFLLADISRDSRAIPLLWMHNLKGLDVVWPLAKNGKPKAFLNVEASAKWVLPVKNYVLLRRFTSKEQKRRLYASILFADGFPFPSVGIENHVNYIHKPGGTLSVDECFGIAAILNSTLVDNYFRTVNGNTQVNASDIRNLPFPDINAVVEIGGKVQECRSLAEINYDDILATMLDIDIEIPL